MNVGRKVNYKALVAVIVKDWDFWFPPRTELQDAAYSPSKTKAPSIKSDNTTARAVPAKPNVKPAQSVPSNQTPMTAKAERTALPPMSVEVVSGNHHTVLPGRNNAVNVDLGAAGTTPVTATTSAAPVVSAAEHTQLSQQATQAVTKSVAPDYPLLARQMKVQGAVILQALISREGSIQELQVLSGPGILASAAREAVRQWRFKPYFLNGEAVETQARITVNFTISTI